MRRDEAEMEIQRENTEDRVSERETDLGKVRGRAMQGEEGDRDKGENQKKQL